MPRRIAMTKWRPRALILLALLAAVLATGPVARSVPPNDANAHDANAHDANAHDANAQDANAQDANAHDANTSDVKPTDAKIPETPDAKTFDAKTPDAETPNSKSLAAPDDFAAIADPRSRSAAYFTELGKVLTNPRCTNCHPRTDRPRQGDQARLHQPPVFRGADGFGLPALRCASCHRDANFDPAGMPGHAEWHLAPPEMAWEGKSVSEICAQIKDPKRNGGRSLHDLVVHIGTDTLVGWAWAPGAGRTPAPGTQKQAGALVEAWAESGAACP